MTLKRYIADFPPSCLNILLKLVNQYTCNMCMYFKTYLMYTNHVDKGEHFPSHNWVTQCSTPEALSL